MISLYLHMGIVQALQLLSEIDDHKTIKTKWEKKVPTQNNLLVPDDGESLKAKETKNDIVVKSGNK